MTDIDRSVANSIGLGVLTCPTWYNGPREMSELSAGELFDALTAPLGDMMTTFRDDFSRRADAAYTVAIRIRRSGLDWSRWGFSAIHLAAKALSDLETAGFDSDDAPENDRTAAVLRERCEKHGLSLHVGNPSTSGRRWFDGEVERVAG